MPWWEKLLGKYISIFAINTQKLMYNKIFCSWWWNIPFTLNYLYFHLMLQNFQVCFPKAEAKNLHRNTKKNFITKKIRSFFITYLLNSFCIVLNIQTFLCRIFNVIFWKQAKELLNEEKKHSNLSLNRYFCVEYF